MQKFVTTRSSRLSLQQSDSITSADQPQQRYSVATAPDTTSCDKEKHAPQQSTSQHILQIEVSEAKDCSPAPTLSGKHPSSASTSAAQYCGDTPKLRHSTKTMARSDSGSSNKAPATTLKKTEVVRNRKTAKLPKTSTSERLSQVIAASASANDELNNDEPLWHREANTSGNVLGSAASSSEQLHLIDVVASGAAAHVSRYGYSSSRSNGTRAFSHKAAKGRAPDVPRQSYNRTTGNANHVSRGATGPHHQTIARNCSGSSSNNSQGEEPASSESTDPGNDGCNTSTLRTSTGLEAIGICSFVSNGSREHSSHSSSSSISGRNSALANDCRGDDNGNQLQHSDIAPARDNATGHEAVTVSTVVNNKGKNNALFVNDKFPNGQPESEDKRSGNIVEAAKAKKEQNKQRQSPQQNRIPAAMAVLIERFDRYKMGKLASTEFDLPILPDTTQQEVSNHCSQLSVNGICFSNGQLKSYEMLDCTKLKYSESQLPLSTDYTNGFAAHEFTSTTANNRNHCEQNKTDVALVHYGNGSTTKLQHLNSESGSNSSNGTVHQQGLSPDNKTVTAGDRGSFYTVNLSASSSRSTPDCATNCLGTHDLKCSKQKIENDYKIHRYLLIAIVVAFIIWATIFFPILQNKPKTPETTTSNNGSSI